MEMNHGTHFSHRESVGYVRREIDAPTDAGWLLAEHASEILSYVPKQAANMLRRQLSVAQSQSVRGAHADCSDTSRAVASR